MKRTTETGGQGADEIESADAGSLPFTGAPLLPWLVLACGLLVSGLLLRRLTSTTGAVEPAPPAVPPGVLPRTRALPSRGAIVLQSLVLLALGMLMSRRTRR